MVTPIAFSLWLRCLHVSWDDSSDVSWDDSSGVSFQRMDEQHILFRLLDDQEL